MPRKTKTRRGKKRRGTMKRRRMRGGGPVHSTHKPDRTVEVRVGIDMYNQYQEKNQLKVGDLLIAKYAGHDDSGDADEGDYDVYLPSDTDTDKIKIGTMLSKSKPKYESLEITDVVNGTGMWKKFKFLQAIDAK